MRPPPFPWRFLRACASLLGCAGAALCAPAPLAAQEVPAGFQEGIYEVVVAGLRPVSVPVLLSPAGRPLLPVRAVAELTGTPVSVEAGGRVVVARPRGVGSATLDVEARQLTAAGRDTLGPDELVRWGTDVYLEAGRLGALFEAQAAVDEGALTVTFSRDPPFPAQERLVIAAARRRGIVLAPGEALPEVAFQPRTGGGVLEWGVASLFPQPGVPSSVYLRAGVGVWGGMLRLGGSLLNGAPVAGMEARGDASYHRVFPRSQVVRQVQVGDVVAEGLRARSIRGLTLTNAPFARDALFGEATFAPRLPAGWEYELYQDGRLLGFSGSGGEAVSVPLRYGSTPLQVRMYGPAGERIENSVTYLIPPVQLPAGRFQYAAGAGACPRGERCTGFGYADLRYGASAAVTVIGGVEAEAVDDSTGARVLPYAGASLLPAPGWVVDAQGMVGEFARLQVQRFSPGNLSGALSAGVQFPRGGGNALLGSGGFSPLADTSTHWHVDGSVRLRRVPVVRALRALDLGARVDGTSDGGMDRMRLSAATAVGGVLMEAIHERQTSLVDSIAAPTLTLFRAHAALGQWFPGRLWSPVLLAAVGMGNEGLERWEGGVSLSPRNASLSASVRWQRGVGSPAVVIGSTMRTGVGRAAARMGSRDGRAEGGASLEGAVALGRGTPVETLPYGGLGLTGISGRVFHDLDGDGRFSEGDEPVADAAVSLGSLRVSTDARGRYATWAVLPYEILAVRLDTASLADPAWLAVRTDTLLRPSPHLFTAVDFALVQTKEVSGRLVAGPGVGTPAGVTVEIVNRRTGAAERVLTFSDGEFYVGRVLPGDYELRVAESSLRALGAAQEQPTIVFTVSAASDVYLVDIPPVRLIRR